MVADYVSLPQGYWVGSPYDALRIDQGVRDWIEGSNSAIAAQTIFSRLPRTPEQAETLLTLGNEAAKNMSWEVVARDYLLPGIRRAVR